MDRIFSRKELSEYTGINGKEAFVGYNGKVYDVTGSFHWKSGKHWVLHEAGNDLTLAMKDAPHFDDLLMLFKVIGILEQEKDIKAGNK